MSPLSDFIAWMRRRRAARMIKIAEQKRAAVQAQIAYRKPKKAEYKFLEGILKSATEDSLRATVEGR